MTGAMVVSLCLYAFFTKTDFTMMGGLLCVVSITMCMFGIFVIFIHNRVLDIVWCAIGVIVFGIYLIYDTQLIIG
jgi:FtsH-binding integral membrane protein